MKLKQIAIDLMKIINPMGLPKDHIFAYGSTMTNNKIWDYIEMLEQLKEDELECNGCEEEVCDYCIRNPNYSDKKRLIMEKNW